MSITHHKVLSWINCGELDLTGSGLEKTHDIELSHYTWCKYVSYIRKLHFCFISWFSFNSTWLIGLSASWLYSIVPQLFFFFKNMDFSSVRFTLFEGWLDGASIRKRCYYPCGHNTTTTTSWGCAHQSHTTGFMCCDAPSMFYWKGTHHIMEQVVVNQSTR